MKGTITKIGNSKGIILPAQILKECQFDSVVSIDVRDNTIVISKPNQPRSGWAEAFATREATDDALLVNDALSNEFDQDEWSW